MFEHRSYGKTQCNHSESRAGSDELQSIEFRLIVRLEQLIVSLRTH